jgi:predicted DNA-binding transcriptional regulator AlpA
MVRNAIARQPATDAPEADVSAPYPLPETGYLRLHQIIGRPARRGRPAIPALIPVSRSTWWAGVKTGRYPQPVRRLGRRITAWRVEDVLALIEPAEAATGGLEKQRA